jgi:hypothetical protein
MSQGHWHDPRAGSQNLGNHLGSRSCVRQSRLYREVREPCVCSEIMQECHGQRLRSLGIGKPV